MTRIMILGGNGFIGKNLQIELSLSNNSQHIFNFSKSLGYDLRDYEKSKKTFNKFKPDIIFNLASHGGSLHYVANNAAEIIKDNILMSINLYRIAQDLPSVIIINPISNCSYPGDTDIQNESAWLSGNVHSSVFSFANSKRILYDISKCYYQQYKIKTINLIFPNAFGFYDHVDPSKTHAISGMIIRMLRARENKDQLFEVWGSGTPVREWIFSKDFAHILKMSLMLDCDMIEPVNIAQGKGHSIMESAYMIKNACGYNGNIVFNTNYQDGDPVKILSDAKFRSIPLFRDYNFVNHNQAIIETVKYYEMALYENTNNRRSWLRRYDISAPFA